MENKNSKIWLYVLIRMCVIKMEIFSVRIDSKTREDMKKLKHINWSEVVRQAIRKRIEKEKRKNVAKAVLLNERVRKKSSSKQDTTEIIREWRDKRLEEYRS